jgi:hypothetical protein
MNRNSQINITMAIWKPGTDPLPNHVVDGLMLGARGVNSPQVQAANNNRGRPTGQGSQARGPSGAGFLNLDNQITALDASYDALADQTPWVTYAANIAGEWQLCANCSPESSGKKLYRQYNFNRQLLGLATVISPIDDTEYAQPTEMDATFNNSASSPPQDVISRWLPPTNDPWVVAQVGQIGANPMYHMDEADNDVHRTAGPIFDFYLSICKALALLGPPGTVKTAVFNCCTMMPSGAPGLQVQLDLGVFN